MVKYRNSDKAIKARKKNSLKWGQSFVMKKRDPNDLGFDAPRKPSLKSVDAAERLY